MWAVEGHGGGQCRSTAMQKAQCAAPPIEKEEGGLREENLKK